MPAAPHDEHAVDEPGGVLMGPALEIHRSAGTRRSTERMEH